MDFEPWILAAIVPILTGLVLGTRYVMTRERHHAREAIWCSAGWGLLWLLTLM